MTEVFPLVYFTHAELKENENLEANLELKTPVNDTKKLKSSFESSRPKKKLKLTIHDDNMNYEAFEEDEQPFMVGVLDKRSGKISVCNTSYFLMKPECYLSTNEEKNNSLAIDQSISYSEKLNSLTAAFGSSKKRKAMQTKLKNKLDAETLETAISAAVEETIMNPIRLNAANEDEANEKNEGLEEFSIMPIPNKEAKEPNEVYNLNEILSFTPHEFERYTLELSKKFVIATPEAIGKWKEMNIYPDYVCEHLSHIVNSKSNQQFKMIKCKQLAYMSYLIQLYRLSSAQLRSKAPLHAYQIADSTASKLFSLYTVVSTDNSQSKRVRSIPRRLKDKLTCHILILALHIDDFLTNLDSLQRDLKMSMQKLSDFYQALGCYIKSSVVSIDSKRILSKKASLSLPLNDVSKNEAKKRARKL